MAASPGPSTLTCECASAGEGRRDPCQEAGETQLSPGLVVLKVLPGSRQLGPQGLSGGAGAQTGRQPSEARKSSLSVSSPLLHHPPLQEPAHPPRFGLSAFGPVVNRGGKDWPQEQLRIRKCVAWVGTGSVLGEVGTPSPHHLPGSLCALLQSRNDASPSGRFNRRPDTKKP